MTDGKSKRGGARPGAGHPFGVGHNERARERIRTARLTTIAQEIAEAKIGGDPKRLAVRLQACNMLLKKTLPDLTQVDLTTGGEPFVIERAVFKRGKETK